MRRDDLDFLRCPRCGGKLWLAAGEEHDGDIECGELRCGGCVGSFPIERRVARFVPAESYANSFGLQWNAFRKTQLDSTTGLPISRNRFFAESGWRPEDLAGKRVLDVGCGAGRFSEIALAAGARLVSVDYSSAVDACMANLGPHPRLTVLQADVYHLPFAPESFDYVCCFGVLQHTPDPRAALLALVPPLKRGGRLAFDFYRRMAANVLWPKYWLRPLTRRMKPETLFAIVQSVVPRLLPVSNALVAVPVLGPRLRYLLPVMNYRGIFPFSATQHREWSILDTFDMLAPAHDHPQNAQTVRGWVRESGLREVDVCVEGLVVGRGVK